MGVSKAKVVMERFGGVRWKSGEEARQGDMLESRFDCLKETYSELGERSMVEWRGGQGQRKVGVVGEDDGGKC